MFGVSLHCHYSQVHSDLELYYLSGSHILPGHDTKLHLRVGLQFCVQSTSSLPFLPGPLLSGIVVTARVPSIV